MMHHYRRIFFVVLLLLLSLLPVFSGTGRSACSCDGDKPAPVAATPASPVEAPPATQAGASSSPPAATGDAQPAAAPAPSPNTDPASPQTTQLPDKAPDYSAVLTPKTKTTLKKKTIAIYSLQIADCGQLPEVEEFKRTKSQYSRDAILKLQICLMGMGYYRGNLDTIPGPLTIEALAMARAKQGAPAAPAQLQANAPIATYVLTQIDFDDWKTFNDIVEQLKQLQTGDYVGESNASLPVVAQSAIKGMTAQYATYEATVLKLVEQNSLDTLTEASFAALTGEQVPEGVVNGLRALQDEPFSGKSGLIKAIKAKMDEIKQPTEAFQQDILQALNTLPADASPEQYFARMAELQVPADLLQQLEAIREIDYPNKDMFVNALKCRVLQQCTPTTETAKGATAVGGEAYGERIVAKARKEHLPGRNRPFRWRGWGCGCHLQDSSTTTYGFAPFWKGGDVQRIDFSAFSRIGYFALPFDNNGNLPQEQDRLQWQRKSADFVNMAHRYHTKVDLVVYKNNWQNWEHLDDQQRSFFIDNLTSNLVSAIDQKLDNSLLNRLMPLFSLGSVPVPTMGDGVTVFFENYPNDFVSQHAFQALIKQLRQKLDAAARNYRLQVVLPYGEYDQLLALRDEVDLFLIFLPEPTKEKKKELRQQIEEKLSGEQRRDTLRKIVPILATGGLTEDGTIRQQFTDDMIYFQDDFAGAGFWPVPTSDETGATGISETLHNIFTGNDASDYFLSWVNDRFPWIGTFVCPHRWELRLALDLLLAVIVLSFLLCCWSYEIQAFFRRHALWCLAVIGACLLILLALSIGDPYQRNVTSAILLLTLVAAALAGLWFFFRKLKQSDLP